MKDSVHLENAPIKEAIVQIRAVPSKKLEISALKKFSESQEDDYPILETQSTKILEYISSDTNSSTGITDKGISGYKIRSADGKNIAQIFPDRLNVSRLEKYRDWDHLISETKRLWTGYISATGPKEISGISVRYINQFVLPEKMKNFEEYLKFLPNIPEDLPQGYGSFYTNVRIPDSDSGSVANVQLVFEGVKPTKDSIKYQIPIVLDVDVFKIVQLDINTDELWDELEKLHVYKNDIFFSSLTDKCMELFK